MVIAGLIWWLPCPPPAPFLSCSPRKLSKHMMDLGLKIKQGMPLGSRSKAWTRHNEEFGETGSAFPGPKRPREVEETEDRTAGCESDFSSVEPFLRCFCRLSSRGHTPKAHHQDC